MRSGFKFSLDLILLSGYYFFRMKTTSNWVMVAWGIILVLVMALTAYLQKGTLVPQKDQNDNQSPKGKIFSQSGILSQGLDDEWILAYQGDKKDSLKIKLSFSDESVCGLVNQYQKCDLKQFKIGSEAKIEGLENDNLVKVDRLTWLKE